jgi:hypothetical protein
MVKAPKPPGRPHHKSRTPMRMGICIIAESAHGSSPFKVAVSHFAHHVARPPHGEGAPATRRATNCN